MTSTLTFEPITADNICRTAEYFKYKVSRTSDYTVGAMYMWREYHNTSFAVCNDMILYKVTFLNRVSFTIPLGGGSMAGAMEALKGYCRENGIPLWFCTVPEEALPVLTQEFNGTLLCPVDPDWADYLYLAEDLAGMEGRRYSGQRNHINKFKKSYPDYRYERMTPENLSRVIDFLQDYQKYHSKEDSLAQEELKRALELMPLIVRFKLPGAFIEADGKIVSLAVGEIVNDTLFVHIEKADREYQGSYQMIVKEFSADMRRTYGIQYINREEDCGDEGLRTSKQSYHPYRLLYKYCVIVPYNHL